MVKVLSTKCDTLNFEKTFFIDIVTSVELFKKREYVLYYVVKIRVNKYLERSVVVLLK